MGTEVSVGVGAFVEHIGAGALAAQLVGAARGDADEEE